MKVKIEELYKANYRQLYQIARNILGSDEDARDAVNDAFAKLLSSKTKIEAGGELRFLSVCVRNICLNSVKHKSIHERFSQMCFATERTNYDDDGYWKDTADEVMNIVSSVFTERMQSVFRLRFVEGRKYDEIAAELGVSRMTVYNNLIDIAETIKEKVKLNNK